MKISVITVCYNGASTIEQTLKSVAEQAWNNIEHIVIDGGSVDGTMLVVDSYRFGLAHVVSEKDNGIYDAMNKGIALATGDVIGFINADDFYPSTDVLEKVARVFENPSLDACYGDLCYVGQNDSSSTIRYWKSSEFVPGTFEAGWCPPHPTFFVRRSIYKRFGGFSLNYKIAADVELMMRFLEVHKIRAHYLPEVLVHMRMGGQTNKSLSNIVKQNREILRALRLHNRRASVWRLMGSKLISRGWQFFVRPKPVGN